MDEGRWKQIERIFEKAVELPPDQREEWVRSECGGDETLETEVLEMLAADGRSADFIESPVFAESTFSRLLPEHDDELPADLVGSRIGTYEIVRELGRGGMGAVYLAKRADREFEQLAAIKLIKRGMDTDFILKRFRNERQILATLNHPLIARLLDGGTTGDGLPYFVMEYVQGEPIHSFSDRRRLSISERLELFQKVCAAVSYAHENLIIHRDLKPGNILVTDKLDLKLLDFGIAKILDPEFAGDSLAHTVTGMRLMTPEYASPEQIKGEDLTPASDIYALGVLLFELLSGRSPYRFASKAPHDIARAICEEEPVDPVFALENPAADEPEDAEKIARRRGTSLDLLKRELGGELRKILLKALRKSPKNRYGSALEFSRDIGAYLDGNPVSAPDPESGQFPLFENSIKGALSLAVLPFKFIDLSQNTEDPRSGSFLSLGLADAVITRLSNLRTAAVRPTSSILRYADGEDIDPREAGRELNAAYILDGRIQLVGERVRVTAQLTKCLDNQTVWAGHFEEQSDDLLTLQDSISAQVSEALVEMLSGETLAPVEKRGTDNAQAYEAYLRGRFHWHSYTVEGLAKALVYFYEAIALDPEFARAYSGVADYYNFLSIFGIMPPNESFPAAKEAAMKAIELDPELAEAHISLGMIAFGYDWDNKIAEKHLKLALKLNPNLGDAHLWYAQLLSLQGRHDDAIREMTKAERLNPQSPSVLVTCAFVFRNARRFERSLEKLRQALRIQPHYYIAEQAFSWLVKFLGNHEETIRMCETAVANTNRLGLPLYALGYSLAVAGQTEEAQAILEELQRSAERSYVPEVYHALIYTALGDHERAFEWLAKALENKDFWIVFFPVDPRFDDLRADPRFDQLAERIGPADEQDNIHQSRVPTRLMSAHDTDPVVVRPTAAAGSRMRVAAVAAGFAAVIIFAGWWTGLFNLTYGTLPGPSNVADNSRFPATAAGKRSIAVMPFLTDAHLEEEQSLGVGLAESLYRRLGVVAELSVRPALLNLSDSRSVQEIGKSFGVDLVLRGSLEKAEDSFKVSAELVDTGTGRIVWAERFDESSEDFPSLQPRIADRVVNALTLTLTRKEREQLNKQPTANSEAYQLFLAGRFLMRDRSVENLQKAVATFERAKAADPGFSLAYAGLADAYALLNLYQVPPPPDAYPKAKANAEKALELDPNSAEAHASLAYVLFYGDWNRTEAVEHFTRAIGLNASYSTAHHWFALALAAMDRPEQSVRQIELALELEPQSPIVPSAAGLVYFYARRYEDGLRNCRRSVELNALMVPAYKTMRVIHEAQGKGDAANEAYLKERSFRGNTDENHPGWSMITAQVRAVQGDREGASKALSRAVASSTVTANPRGYAYEIAVAYALLGENGKSLEWLEKARAARDHGFNFVLVDPRLDGLRNSERYRKVVAGAFK